MYTSKTVQNELISIIGESIRTSLTKNMDYFSIIADELTEQISNKEILSICLRFVKWTENEFSLILYIVPELLVKLLQQLF